MDTRKLTTYQHKRSSVTHIGRLPNFTKVCTMGTGSRTEDVELGAELVKRFNAHPQLVDFIKTVAMGNTEADTLATFANGILATIKA